jgi:hypothetical protein
MSNSSLNIFSENETDMAGLYFAKFSITKFHENLSRNVGVTLSTD